MECEAQSGKPCLQCRQCRKVLEDIHPDVQTVQDPDHRELPVDLLRSLRQDAYIRPNDGAAKVYIFPDCDALNQRDQNVLLKLVEEGPPYAAFLFCTETAAALLPTIRSSSCWRTPGEPLPRRCWPPAASQTLRTFPGRRSCAGGLPCASCRA